MHARAGQDRVIDGLPSGERTTTFKINQEVRIPMPLSQEAEMMKKFSEIVTATVSTSAAASAHLVIDNIDFND